MNKKKLLVGSRAIQTLFPDFPRKPKDTDYIVNKDATITCVVDEFELPFLFDYPNDASLHLTLKASHLGWNINWWKHAHDVRFLLNKGVKINKELYDRLFEFWEKHHYIRKCNFQQSKQEFFKDTINRKYDHDELHEIINPNPSYKLVVPEGVMPIQSLYEALTQKNRIKIAQEECYVIALERYLIPYDMKESAHAAYKRALKLLFTSLAPNWMIIHLIGILDSIWNPSINYTKIFKDAVFRN